MQWVLKFRACPVSFRRLQDPKYTHMQKSMIFLFMTTVLLFLSAHWTLTQVRDGSVYFPQILWIVKKSEQKREHQEEFEQLPRPNKLQRRLL